MVEQPHSTALNRRPVARSYSNWSQVQSGDVLVAVNGRNVRGSSIQAVAQVILGPIGSSVTPTPSSSILVTLHFLVLDNSTQRLIYLTLLRSAFSVIWYSVARGLHSAFLLPASDLHAIDN
jgi:hypothetical protein